MSHKHTLRSVWFSLRVLLLLILIQTFAPRARVCMLDTHKTPYLEKIALLS
jgi:hypothetical protein